MGQTSYPLTSHILRRPFVFEVRQSSLQRLNLPYKANWALYKMIGAFWPPYVFLQPLLQFLSTIPSSTWSNFHVHISPPYLFTKPFLQFTPTLSFLYNSANFPPYFSGLPEFYQHKNPDSLLTFHKRPWPFVSHNSD